MVKLCDPFEKLMDRTTLKPWETIVCWYVQGNQHSIRCCEMDFVHPQKGDSRWLQWEVTSWPEPRRWAFRPAVQAKFKRVSAGFCWLGGATEYFIGTWDPIWLFFRSYALDLQKWPYGLLRLFPTTCRTNMGFVRVMYANDRKIMAIRANTAKYGMTEKNSHTGCQVPLTPNSKYLCKF